MAIFRRGSGARTPTGRNVNDYLGRPPKASGTGPKNLAKNAAQATSQVRAGRPKASRASNPRASAALASGGIRPPGGAGSGIPKATTPLASSPRSVINKSKSGKPRRSGRASKPRADFPSKI